jgi:hypothetical protein
VVGAVVAALVVGTAVWKLRPAPTTTSPTVGPSVGPGGASPVPQTGVLVVDATPWGEVTRVVRDGGAEAPLSPGPTPVALVLAPGAYSVLVTNPKAGQPITLRVTVESGRQQTVRAEFTRIDVADYFRDTGW